MLLISKFYIDKRQILELKHIDSSEYSQYTKSNLVIHSSLYVESRRILVYRERESIAVKLALRTVQAA